MIKEYVSFARQVRCSFCFNTSANPSSYLLCLIWLCWYVFLFSKHYEFLLSFCLLSCRKCKCSKHFKMLQGIFFYSSWNWFRVFFFCFWDFVKVLLTLKILLNQIENNLLKCSQGSISTIFSSWHEHKNTSSWNRCWQKPLLYRAQTCKPLTGILPSVVEVHNFFTMMTEAYL